MTPFLFRIWKYARPVVFGLIWTFLLFFIPLLIALLIPGTKDSAANAVTSIFSLTNFVIVTSLAFYSQTLMERLVERLRPLDPIPTGTKPPEDSRFSRKFLESMEGVACFIGIVMVCVWFVSLKGREFELLDRNFTVTKNDYLWIAAFIMMPTLGLIRALKYPGFEPSEGTPI